MKQQRKRTLLSFGLGAAILAGVTSLVLSSMPPAAGVLQPSADNHYIGAAKCKNCHQSDATGNQYTHWEASKHAKAYETLATDAAKKIAAEKGIDDPQKSDACMKCHQTGFGMDAAMFAKGFDAKKGVQCESCHGPGEKHMKARFAAALEQGDKKPEGPIDVPEGEILTNPPQKTCLACHNSESPSFQPFCFHKRKGEIRHLDPRRVHAEGGITDCGCGDGCACKDGCPDDGCGVPAKK